MRAWRLLATAWRSLLRGAVAAVPGVLLVSCTFAPLPSGPEPGSDPTTTATVDASAPGRTPPRGPPSLEWWVRPDQLGAQSAAGAFAVKFVEIANLDLHVYYGMRSPTPGPPRATMRVTATACPPSMSNEPVGPVSVQSFGQLADMDMGVIHVPIANHSGQVFTLVITPPGAASAAWALSLLEQVAPIAHPQGFEGNSVDQDAVLPEVHVAGALGYQGNRWSGYFAFAQSGAPTTYVPSTFFVLQHDGTVTQISQADFTSGNLGGAANVSPYIPGPTYPPTSTPVGTAAGTPTPPRVQC